MTPGLFLEKALEKAVTVCKNVLETQHPYVVGIGEQNVENVVVKVNFFNVLKPI